MSRPLALVAHGSADPRFAAVVGAVAARVVAALPAVEVRVGYLEHGPPSVGDAVTRDAVVVPLLLSSGFHVLVDLPEQAPDAQPTEAIGPDALLADALADRLREAGDDGSRPVLLAATGSADARSRADVERMAALLGDRIDRPVRAAYLSTGEPQLTDAASPDVAVASYLLAAGVFHDRVRACGAALVSEPLGDHPAVAEVVLRRYRAALGGADDQGRTAPA